MTVSIIICVLLHKLGCIRQFENKISLRSLALTLHKLGCIRQFENKIATANACQNIRYTANGHTHYYILG